MAQNFRTRPVALDQRQYDLIQDFPLYPGKARRRMLGEAEYHVVDVTLRSGACFEGLLVMRGDTLLVPEFYPDFESEDIAEISSTPRDEIPEFTITDPEAISGPHSLSWENAWRLDLFGPEPEPKNWREAPLDKAHEQALKDHGRVETYGGELPACYHGPHSLVLTRGGIRLSYTRVQDEEEETVVLRPKHPDLWADLLRSHFDIDPSFTLAELIELLDLPPAVDREVYLRTMPYRQNTFRPWVEAVREEGFGSDTDLEYIEVGAYADEDEGEYTFFFDVSAIGYPLAEDDEETGFYKGERKTSSLSYGGPARLRHLPIRYNPVLIIPVDHERTMEYLRGTLHDWRLGGEIGPRPEMPILFRTRRSITLGEFIGAIFSELSSHNVHPGEREDDEEEDHEEEDAWRKA